MEDLLPGRNRSRMERMIREHDWRDGKEEEQEVEEEEEEVEEEEEGNEEQHDEKE